MTHSVRLRRVRGALAFSIGLAAVLSPILGASSRAAPSPQPERPYNILLIVSDDQALRSMAPMPKTRTWFRNEGVKLTNAFATTPLCCPSRSTILTGRYAHNHNVRANTQALNLDTSTTIQHILEQAGYRTGVFGKFLNSWDVATAPPDFDEWAVIPRSSQAYRDGAWNVNGTLQQVEEYGTSFVADAAVGFIE